MADLPYGEDLNYWKTGRSVPDVWIERTRGVIESLGGQLLQEAFGQETQTGQAAFMLAFEIGGERFKLVWPVLPTKSGDDRAARVQAASMLYHDVKGRCVRAAVFGARNAFFECLLLPDGRQMMELSAPEVASSVPKLLTHDRSGEP